MRGSHIAGGVDGQRNGVASTSRTASAVAAAPVMCTGLPNARDVNGVGKVHTTPGLKSRQLVGERFKVRVGTWNVGTLTGKSRELVEVLKRRKVNICCVQETRWKGEKAKEIGEGYKIIYAGKTSSRNGVGVVVDEVMKANVVGVVRKSDRVIIVKLVLGSKVLNVVSAYAPQIGCEESLKEEFWREMDEIVQGIPGREDIVIGGDMNGHLGSNRTGYERVHGGYGFGERNYMGERVLDFAQAYELAIVNTFYRKREEHYITFKSGENKSQIDCLMWRRESIKRCKDCKVIPGESVVTQHRLLVLDFWCEGKRGNKRKEQINKEPKIRWWKLTGENEKLFARKMKEEVVWSMEGSVDEIWSRVVNGTKKVAVDVLGESKGRLPQDKETWWWDNEVQEIVLKKKAQFKKWQKDRRREDWLEYKKLNKEVKSVVREAKFRKYDGLYESLGTKEGEKEIYKLAKIREKRSRDFQYVWCIKGEDKEVLTRHEDVKKRWKEYFEKLLNEEFPREEETERVAWNLGMVDLIREEEVWSAVRKMKKKKAVGPDGVPVEVWQVLGDFGVRWLTGFLNKVLVDERIPELWRKSILVPIFKGKGDVQVCGNYRGIKLMCHSMKVWEKVIDKRIRSETAVSKNQFGFMPGKSTMEPIFCMRQIVEKYREKKRKLCMVFIDLEKAYDRVPREVLEWTLRKKGVPRVYVKVIEEMYEGASTRVRSLCGETEDFSVRVGVHQGSALSPYLFSLILDEITKDIQGELPWCMMFADDVVLVGESPEELGERLEVWREALEGKGLRISRSKTEVIVFDFGESDSARQVMKMGDDEVGEVDKFKYLGSVVQNNGGNEEDVKNRIKCGWLKWREASGVLCDRRMPIRLKGKFYKTVVRPAMLYGSECWAVDKKTEQRMSVAEMRMLRWMSGVTREDRIRNEYIRGSIGVSSIVEKMRENRLRWFGHVRRREETEAVRVVMDMNVVGKRGRGRPKKRWLDGIESDMRIAGVTVRDVADRALWRCRTRVADPR